MFKRLLGNSIRGYMNLRASRALRDKGYLKLLENRPKNAFPYDALDLWRLYSLVRQKKPHTIIEFGSGCSTILLTQALYDNSLESGPRPGFLYSLDSEEYWAEATLSEMPKYMAGLYEIRHAPVDLVDHKGTQVFRHQNVPEGPVDMMYLDGPPLTADIPVAIDPIDLETSFRPRFVLVVDGRKPNVQYLRAHLQRRYRFQANRIGGNPTFHLLD